MFVELVVVGEAVPLQVVVAPGAVVDAVGAGVEVVVAAVAGERSAAKEGWAPGSFSIVLPG